MCRLILQILTIFQTKKVSFSTPVFRPGGGNKTQHYMFTIKQKVCYHSFLKSMSHFFLFSIEIETTNTLIHNRSSFINHTRFHTKMSKIYTRFQTKTAPKPHPLGGTYLFGLYRGLTPPPALPPPKGTRKILALVTSATFCM